MDRKPWAPAILMKLGVQTMGSFWLFCETMGSHHLFCKTTGFLENCGLLGGFTIEGKTMGPKPWAYYFELTAQSWLPNGSVSIGSVSSVGSDSRGAVGYGLAILMHHLTHPT